MKAQRERSHPCLPGLSDMQRTPGARACALLVLLPLLLITSCHSQAPTASHELIVSAAASLKNAFNELAELNQRQNGVKVRFNFGASGALQKQIETGAPADIFASAGAKQMDELIKEGFILPASRKEFARNELVLIEPANGAALTSFGDLIKSRIKKIAVGNPKTVPAGQYSEQVLTRLKLLPQIQPKLIFAEDVRQVLDYVIRGEVDAGLVYSSDAFSAGEKVKVVARAPEEAIDLIFYPVGIVKESRQQEAAQKFIDLLLSPAGQTILSKHGFPDFK
jgi:molybdate transport system substrate-binding protein